MFYGIYVSYHTYNMLVYTFIISDVSQEGHHVRGGKIEGTVLISDREIFRKH